MNKSVIKNLASHGRDASKGQVNQDNTVLAFCDEFLKDSRHHDEKFWLTEVQSSEQGPHKYKKITFTSWRMARSIDIDQIGVYNCTMQETMDHWHFEFHCAAVALKHQFCKNSEDYQKPIPPQHQDRRREGCKFSEIYRQGSRIELKKFFGAFIFKLVAEWEMGLERVLIKSSSFLIWCF